MSSSRARHPSRSPQTRPRRYPSRPPCAGCRNRGAPAPGVRLPVGSHVVADAPVTLASITPDDLAAVPTAAVDLLRASRRVLAIGHESPDADAFGSGLGIALAVEWLGGRATAMSSDPVPAMYRFMPLIERI